jgi:hypothetical protein
MSLADRPLAPLSVLALLAAPLLWLGCPDPADVGAIPGQRVQDAKARVHAAEVKIDKRTQEAAATKE